MSQQPGGPSGAKHGSGHHGEQHVGQMASGGESQPLNDLVWCLMADRDKGTSMTVSQPLQNHMSNPQVEDHFWKLRQEMMNKKRVASGGGSTE